MKTAISVFFILFSFCAIGINGQTTISSSKTSGCDTLTVAFSYSTSLGTVTTVNWDFGDGTTSTENAPVHKFAAPGAFNVALTLNGSDNANQTINVGKTPEALFGYSDTLEYGSYNIIFRAKYMDPIPFSYSYDWILSDGGTASSRTFLHQFDSVGIYRARLIVSDVYGCADTLIRRVEVSNKLAVVNVFTPNDDGINDLLVIEANGVNMYRLQIFTPSGVKVFETKSKILVWDGRNFSGEKVREGIYYYVITSIDSTPSLNQTGFLYLLR